MAPAPARVYVQLSPTGGLPRLVASRDDPTIIPLPTPTAWRLAISGGSDRVVLRPDPPALPRDAAPAMLVRRMARSGRYRPQLWRDGLVVVTAVPNGNAKAASARQCWSMLRHVSARN